VLYSRIALASFVSFLYCPGAEQERVAAQNSSPKKALDQDDNDSVLTEDLLNSYKQYIVAKSSGTFLLLTVPLCEESELQET